MVTDTRSREELVAENKELRSRLEEAEETLHALGSGAADAIVVSMPDGGEQVFTLQGAEHPYRVLIETMNEGAVTVTSDGTILYCNKSMATLLQVPLEKLIGTKLLSYVAPADSALFAARLESSTREPQKGEISLLSGADDPTPVLFSCCSVELSGSRGMNVLFTDITELKLAETQLQIVAERARASEALRESNERYKSILINIQDAYIRADTEGIVTMVNPSAALMFGYDSFEDMLGLSDLIFYKNSEYRDLLFEKLHRHGKVVDFEAVALRKDGTSIPVSLNAQFYYDAHGKIRGTEAFFRDITERKRVEEELQHNQERLALAADAGQVGMFDLDTESGDVQWTQQQEKIFGYEPTTTTTYTYQEWSERVHPDDLHRVEEQMRQAMEEKVRFQVEHRIVWPNGSMHWINVTALYSFDDSGRCTRLMGAVRDITESKHAQDENRKLSNMIEQEKERLCAVINGISDEVWFADTQQKFTLANPSALQFFGLDATDEIGIEKFVSSMEVFRPDGSPRPIEEAPPLRALRGETVTNEEEIIRNPVTGELRHREVSANSVRDIHDNILGSVSVVRDVTDRKLAEETLSQNVRLLNATGELAKVGGWELNLSPLSLTWTEETCRIHGVEPGYKPKLQEGINFYAPEYRPVIEAAVKRCSESGESWDVEALFNPRGCEESIWVHAMGKGIFKDGKVVKLTGAFQDITERKSAEDLVHASLHEKEVLLKEIHHRVKNNLQVISSLINLQTNTIDDPAVHEHLRDLSDRVRSMALVHEKLYQSENLSSVPFEDYVSALLQYLIHAHGSSNAAIRFSKDLQPVSLWVETAVPCGLILNELISNTFKHAFRGRPHGEVRIALHRSPDGTVCLCVSDDGVGLPPGLDWRQSESLGLRLVQMLTRQLNATMELNCDNGTEFQLTFKLPEVEKDGGRARE